MFIGIMKIELRFPPVSSIKDKRKIVNRIKMKVANRFKVCTAEVDDQDYYNSSIIGVTFISNTRDHAVKKGQKIAVFLEEYESHIYYDSAIIVEEY